MEYRQLEKLGIKTSLLGFGCMRFPRHRDGSINSEKAEVLIDQAYQNGVNYFDTAYNYHEGGSESFTGAALEKYDRSSYYLATKLPHWLVNSLEDAKGIFNKQLERLHKDYIDFYLLHAMNREAFDKMVSFGVLEFLDQLKQEGKIRYIGFSFHDEYDSFSYILNYRDWDFCQIQLNYMDTDYQAGMKGYKLTEQKNIPLIIMEPVKGGNLAKLPDSVAKHFRAIDPERSIASWAFRWVASLSNVKVVLSGMSNEKQVTDNLATFGAFQPMNEAENKAVDAVAKALRKRVKNGCTGCSYCMPCPSGVNIPFNFEIWNEYGIYRNKGEAKWLWTNPIKDEAKAKNCIECGQCEEHCPQKIQIRDNLKKVQAELDAVL
jgi:hypothetical protein